MADRKISELDTISSVAPTDLVAIVDTSGSVTNKVTASNLSGANNFSSRSAAVSALAALSTAEKAAIPDGTIWTAEGLSYRFSTGATDIPDFAGVVPHSMIAESKHFGAACDGTTDDTAAILAMADWFNKGDLGYDVRFSHGTSLFDGGFKTLKNGVVSGYGKESSKLQISLASGVNPFSKLVSDGNASDFIEFHSFAVYGDWGGITDHTDATYQNEQDATYAFFRIYSTPRQSFHNLHLEWCRWMAVISNNAYTMRFFNNTVMHCAREALNAQGCNFAEVRDNFLSWLDDDCLNIACSNESGGNSSDAGNPTEYGAVVSGNMVFQTGDLKVASSRNTSIVGNVLRHMKSDGIAFADNSPYNNSSPATNVQIIGNTITNVFDRTGIDGLTTNSQYIRLSKVAPVAGLAGGIPGEDDGAGGVVPIYEYLHVNEDSVTRSPSMRIVIADNTIGRTRANVSNYSDYGLGQFWTKNGWLDPAITDGELQSGSSEGIFVEETHFDLSIHDNVISGVYDCIVFGNAASPYRRVSVHHNIFSDFIGVGVDVQETGRSEISITENRFDADPYHLRSTRNANGTWSATTEAIAIELDGQVERIEGNSFRNCSRLTSGAGDADVIRGNIVYCNPAAIGDSASNGGVRNIPAPGVGWHHVIEDSDPSSGTFQTVLNTCELEATSQPSSGTYLAGHFVTRSGTGGVTATETLQGWLRLTTGSGHVSGTDWREIRSMNQVSGQWTPELRDGSGNAATMGTQAGYYSRIGDIVTATFRMTITSKGSMSGGLRVYGLPYTTTGSNNTASGTASIVTGMNVTASENIVGHIGTGNDYIQLYLFDGSLQSTALQDTEISDSFQLFMTITYVTGV